LFFLTAGLFALLLTLPVEMRAEVYMPSVNPHLTKEEMTELRNAIIERYGLNDSFVASLVADILYGILDPRVRFQ
jgi:ABC-type dipeptide/oligopeptide/nickel transport system permease component